MERQRLLNQAHTAALSANMTKFSGDIHWCNGYVVGNSQQGWFKNEMSYQGFQEQQQAQAMTNHALYGNVNIRYQLKRGFGNMAVLLTARSD